MVALGVGAVSYGRGTRISPNPQNRESRYSQRQSVNLLAKGDSTWDELWLTCLRVMQRDGNLSFLNGRSHTAHSHDFRCCSFYLFYHSQA